MADEIVTVAEAQQFITPTAGAVPSSGLADRAERGVEIFSRWAGILAFAGAVAMIVWLIV